MAFCERKVPARKPLTKGTFMLPKTKKQMKNIELQIKYFSVGRETLNVRGCFYCEAGIFQATPKFRLILASTKIAEY